MKHTAPSQILAAMQEVRLGGAPMTPSIARKTLGLLSNKKEEGKGMEALSAREADVLKALARGLSYKMVAAELEIATDTVRSHVRKIYDKLHVNSLPEAVSKVFLKK